MKNKKKELLNGLRDGIPIGLGYLAVSFSLGIVAKGAGITAMEGFWASFFTAAKWALPSGSPTSDSDRLAA